MVVRIKQILGSWCICHLYTRNRYFLTGIHVYIVGMPTWTTSLHEACIEINPVYLPDKHPSDTGVDASDYAELTDFMNASKNGFVNVIKLFKTHADINLQNKDRKTALMIASWNGHNDVVNLLLSLNSSSNILDVDRHIALMLASQFGHSDIIRLFLKSGADANIQTLTGYTALTLASQHGYSAIASLLLHSGAKPNLQNSNGSTTLVWPVKMGILISSYFSSNLEQMPTSSHWLQDIQHWCWPVEVGILILPAFS